MFSTQRTSTQLHGHWIHIHEQWSSLLKSVRLSKIILKLIVWNTRMWKLNFSKIFFFNTVNEVNEKFWDKQISMLIKPTPKYFFKVRNNDGRYLWRQWVVYWKSAARQISKKILGNFRNFLVTYKFHVAILPKNELHQRLHTIYYLNYYSKS